MMAATGRLQDVIAECRATGNFDRLVDAIPYATFLGMRCEVDGDGNLLFCLPAKQENIGNACGERAGSAWI